MNFDRRTRALISVGASVAANCLPCLENHAGKAFEAGLTEEEIRQAIEVGRSVRQGAANQMDQLVTTLFGQSRVMQSRCEKGCC